MFSAVTLLAGGMLSACGGGGGGDASPAATPANAPMAMALAGTSGSVSSILSVADSVIASKAAAGYYVDATAGSDDQPGTFTQPWKTLARAANVRLQPGEGLYLRCGSVWRESLSLGSDQLVDGSVVAGYGADCASRKAVITGADNFSGGWALERGVWSRSLPSNTPKITQLFVDGKPLRTAQWPDAPASDAETQATVKGTATATASTKQAFAVQAADAAFLATTDLVGATVQLRTHPWLIETRRITGYAAGAIEIQQPMNWPLLAGQRFVLQDKRWMLDQPGEFFHDVVAQRLYLMAPAATPSLNLASALVEGSVRDVALTVAARRNLVVRDMGLLAARDAALVANQTPAISIVQVEASQSALAGIRLVDSADRAVTANDAPSVTDSLLQGNGLLGLDAANAKGVRFARNTVLNTGQGPHQAANTLAAVETGPGARVEDNLVDGAGYIGIRFSSRDGTLVKGNTVTGVCTRLVDCAGIYTYTGRQHIQPGHTSSVVENRIYGGQPSAASADASTPYISGIYVDDHADGVTVANNLVFDMPVGVFVHNASRLSVRNNRLWLVKRAGIWASMDQTDADWMRLNVFEGNQIVPVVQAQASSGALPSFTAANAIWFWHVIDGTAALGPSRNLFRDNAVVELQGALAVHAWLHGGGSADTVGAARWLKLNPGERQPSRPAHFKPLLPTLGQEQVADSGFDLGLSQWRTWNAPSSETFKAVAVSNRSDCTGGCVNFTTGHRGDLLANEAFVLKERVPYVYRVSLATNAAGGAQLAAPYISRDTTPWDDMASAQGHQSYLSLTLDSGERLEYESYFMPKTVAPARVNLQLETTGVTVSVDQVSVREVLGYQRASLGDWARVVLAPQRASGLTMVGCAELGWPAGCSAIGLDGALVALPLAMGPGTERMLLRADSPFRR